MFLEQCSVRSLLCASGSLLVSICRIPVFRTPGSLIVLDELECVTHKGVVRVKFSSGLGPVVSTGLLVCSFGLAPIACADPSWTMPNLIGKDLQGAQDAIQSLTNGLVWYSGSTDLTGKGRSQVIDRNWVVCTSTPPPGTTITTSTNITFGVVRIDTEKCP